MRTSIRTLEYLTSQLSSRLGRPQYRWYSIGKGTSIRHRCLVGALTLDQNASGKRLMEVISAGGGLREVSPRLPASQMEDYLRAMHVALDFVESNQTIKPWDHSEVNGL